MTSPPTPSEGSRERPPGRGAEQNEKVEPQAAPGTEWSAEFSWEDGAEPGGGPACDGAACAQTSPRVTSVCRSCATQQERRSGSGGAVGASLPSQGSREGPLGFPAGSCGGGHAVRVQGRAPPTPIGAHTARHGGPDAARAQLPALSWEVGYS